MKRIFLTKHNSSLDIAHFYEHLFFRAVCAYFLEKDLFQYVDYSIAAKTNLDGTVVLDFELYTSEAEEAFKAVPDLGISTKKDDMLSVLSQLVAEESRAPGGTDLGKLPSALRKMDVDKWNIADDIPQNPAFDQSKTTSDEIFFFTNKVLEAGPDISVSVQMNTDTLAEKKLKVVYSELSKMIIDNLQAILPNTFGIYSYKDHSDDDVDTLRYINYFKTTYNEGPAIALKDIAKDSKRVVQRILQPALITRYRLSLHDAPLKDLSNIMTDARIREVVSNLAISVARGNETYVVSDFTLGVTE